MWLVKKKAGSKGVRGLGGREKMTGEGSMEEFSNMNTIKPMNAGGLTDACGSTYAFGLMDEEGLTAEEGMTGADGLADAECSGGEEGLTNSEGLTSTEMSEHERGEKLPNAKKQKVSACGAEDHKVQVGKNESAATEKDRIAPSFEQICRMVGEAFELQWRATGDAEKSQRLNREKLAILGDDEAVDFYKGEIGKILRALEVMDAPFPPWYKSMTDGVFAELYGLSGLSPWVYDETAEYARSSSAKLIGNKLFCLIDGKAVLQPQRIAGERREQLKRAFLMSTPKERIESGFHEIYLHNGIRISIFSGDRTKKGQEVFVFRKYIVRELTLERLAELGTFPKEAVPLFHAMIRVGFNVVFSGPVRSGKTTFLQAWQLCEDRTLEGLAISTDPETPWHELMPDAPIMQMVADDKELESISKPILRGDNDYVLLEEMRNAVAYRLALELTSQGTQRSKATVHARDGLSLPYKMASAIRSVYGGDMRGILQQIFKNINYVFEFMQLGHDRSQKRLKAIVEYCYDAETDSVSVHKICDYDVSANRWLWNFHMGDDKEEIGKENEEAMREMKECLKKLEEKNTLIDGKVSHPRYYTPQSEKPKI